MPVSKKEAYEKAIEVNNISLRYHLSHATVACDMLLQQEFKKICEERVKQLNNEKEKAFKRGNASDFEKLDKEQKRLGDRRHFHIYVEYLKSCDIKSARTVCVDNQLIIYLPQDLLDMSIDENMSYTKHVVKLRELMAHELGHSLLHTDELYKITSTRGSGELTETPKENEAEWFAEKILELRHLRNEKLWKEGTHKYF